MKAELTGMAWKAFYTDRSVWVGNSYHDDGIILVNGADEYDLDIGNVEDSDVVTVIDVIYYEEQGNNKDLASMIKAWEKNQLNVTFTVAIPKEKAGLFKKIMMDGFSIKA